MTLLNSIADADLSVEVNKSSIACKNFIGFGNEWDSRAYSQNQISDIDYKIIGERIKWMRLPIVRIMIIGNMCYKGKGVFDFETKDMKSLYKNLDICQQLGIDVILTDWGCQSEWLKVPEVKSPADKKYAEVIATYTDFLINKRKYSCIKYLVMINEPNLYPISGQWNKWRTGIKNLSVELKKRKLDKKIILTGSDESCGDEWHYKTVDELKNYFGAYDVHKYANDANVKIGKLYDYFHTLKNYAIKNDAKAKYKPFIVGEAGLNDFANHPFGNEKINSVYYGVFMADYAAQAANAGCDAVLAWMLDDNSHQGFYWGLWSNKNKGMNLRPWFFTWSLLVKYFPKGSVIYKVKQPTKSIRVLAAEFKNNKREREWTFCIINRSSEKERIKIKLSDFSELKMKKFIFNEKNRKTDKNGFPLPVKNEKINLGNGVVCPANSVVLMTTAD